MNRIFQKYHIHMTEIFQDDRKNLTKSINWCKILLIEWEKILGLAFYGHHWECYTRKYKDPNQGGKPMILRKLMADAAVVVAAFAVYTTFAFAGMYRVSSLMAHVKNEASAEGKAIGILIKDQKIEVLKTQDGWHQIKYGKDEAYVQEGVLEAPKAPLLKTLKITGDSLNVRLEADIASKILGRLDKGQEYGILEILGEWIKIDYQEGGWVYAQYVEPEERIENNVTVIAENVNMRTGPGTDGKILDTLKKGTVLTYISNKNGWVQVETQEGTKAWVLGTYIKADGVVIPKPRPVNKVSMGTSRGGNVDRNTDIRTRLVAYAKDFLGAKYLWGGTTPNGFDCSGYLLYVYRNFGVHLNRVASDQARQGVWVSRPDLLPGDVVAFNTDGPAGYISHIGIYIGGGNFIHASGGQFKAGSVRIDSMSNSYYSKAYVTARRFF
jgi:cell wall-associated NlpC family hydrolase